MQNPPRNIREFESRRGLIKLSWASILARKSIYSSASNLHTSGARDGGEVRMAAHGPSLLGPQKSISCSAKHLAQLSVQRRFLAGCSMLSTNLLDMMKDPYSEDRQLAATTETTTTINAFNNSGLFSNHYLEIINIAKKIADGVDVQTTYSDFPTYKNGLLNKELQEQKYETIISYSGGTATASILMQGVRCENLIMVSPMDAAMSADDYAYMIDAILAAGFVNHIQILWSPDDHPTTEWAMFYQASTFYASDKVSIKQVDLSDSGDAHGDILKYAIANIHGGNFIDPDIAAAEKADAKNDAEKNAPVSTGNTRDNPAIQQLQETAKQAKQPETQETPTVEYDAYSEGRKLAAEAFAETYQSTERSANADSSSYKSTIPIPTGSAADALKEQGKYEEYLQNALQAAEERISQDPQDSDAWNTKGLALQYLNRGDESEVALAKAQELGYTGGINFTSIKLSYISISTDQDGGINFDAVLKVQKAEGKSPGIDIKNATRIGATAFMTGLAVNNNKFWVNLNPWEMDRIIDEELGQSEVGRIMLEADLQMKRDFSNYGNPCANETGKALWSLLDKKREALVQQCMNKFPGEIQNTDKVRFRPVTRHWIIPDKAYAYSNETQIYIINSTLAISSEPVADQSTFEIHDQDIGTLSKGCFEELNKSVREYGEYYKDLTDRMILPYVVSDVNNGGKY
jgi:hypothetical protein